jgi:hypothetical protein
MQVKQTNRIRMFKAVEAVLDQNNSVWNGMAPFATAVNEYKQKVAATEVVAQKQETPITGATDERLAARSALEDVLFLTAEALGVLAHRAGDTDLMALTDVTPSTLHNLNDVALTNRATAIQAATVSRTTELATLQVTPENLSELTEALADFNVSKSSPRVATANRSAQTSSLPESLNDVNDILRNQLDRLVNLFRRSDPEFVASYRAARVIVDRAATHQTKPPVPAPSQPHAS